MCNVVKPWTVQISLRDREAIAGRSVLSAQLEVGSSGPNLVAFGNLSLPPFDDIVGVILQTEIVLWSVQRVALQLLVDQRAILGVRKHLDHEPAIRSILFPQANELLDV